MMAKDNAVVNSKSWCEKIRKKERNDVNTESLRRERILYRQWKKKKEEFREISRYTSDKRALAVFFGVRP